MSDISIDCDLCTDLNCSIGSGMVWQLMSICHVFSPILNRLFKTYKKQSSATEREYTAKSIVLANNKEFIINLVKIKKSLNCLHSH